MTRAQLLGLGLSPAAIQRWIRSGRLHVVRRGVYAVGRAELTRRGVWMAAVLSCGPRAVLSHESAAALWEIRAERRRVIDVSVPADVARRRPGIAVHRRTALTRDDVTRRHGIPVTTPVCTLVDIAGGIGGRQLEAAINGADGLGLARPDELRSVPCPRRRRGARALREILDRRTFRLTRSELERRFLPITRRAGLSPPQTGEEVNGFEVDFFWPDLGLVVETDGLTYHRTPFQQARDRLRDQAHTAAGLTPLRFTHAQVKYEPGYVEAVLAKVAAWLAQRR